MLAVSLATRARWPASWMQTFHVAVVGVLLQSVYLGGCYVAMERGIPAGVTALIVGLQPILTATVVGPVLGERVSWRQWLGLFIGFAGVTLVLWDKLHFDNVPLMGVFYALIGLVGISAATIYQKRFCGAVDLRSSAVIQYGAATLFLLPMMGLLGIGTVQWTATFIASIAWLILVLSIGTFTLLLWLHPARRCVQGREPVLSDPAHGRIVRLSRLRRDAWRCRRWPVWGWRRWASLW